MTDYLEERKKTLENADRVIEEFKQKPRQELIERLGRCGIDGLGKMINAADGDLSEKIDNVRKAERALDKAQAEVRIATERQNLLRHGLLNHTSSWLLTQ